jgi:uncharacterized protein
VLRIEEIPAPRRPGATADAEFAEEEEMSMVHVLDETVGTPNPPHTLTIRSEVLGEERRIYVQLPVGYDRSEQVYPVLVVLDGEWLFELARSHVQFYSEFAAMGVEIPRMIVVGIENLDRDRDYVPTPDPGPEVQFSTAGEARRFLGFLRTELFPFLETNYRAAANRTAVGWSFGGLCTLYAAAAMPELFQAYLCMGPSVWWDDDLVVTQFERAAVERPTRMVITLGSDEEGGPVYVSTKRLLGNLEASPIEGLSVTHFEFDGVGHGGGVPLAFSRGLRALFPGYRMQVGDDTTLERVEAYYNTLSDAWGFDVRPTPWVLQTLAAKLWDAGRKDEAIEALDWYIARNPNEPLPHGSRGKFLTWQGRREAALAELETALALELEQPVPCGVYLQGFRERIAEAEKLPVENL